MTVAIYPGTFDPITNGHLDIAARAARLFDRLIIAVYEASSKDILFSTEERLSLVRQSIKSLPNVEVHSFSGLTGDFARRVKAQAMVRGLRMSTDFDREFNMAMMNRRLFPEIEMVCLMASVEYQFLSSTLLKEAVGLGGNISDIVPEHVVTALKERLRDRKPES